MAKTVGIAIFGLGRAGVIHLANILSNRKCTLKYAVDPIYAVRCAIQSQFATGQSNIIFMEGSENDLETIFTDDEVTAVFVCSSTPSHYSITRTALKHGKAVFCEKPVSIEISLIEDLYRKAAENRLPLHCSFNRRFDPQIMQLKSRILNGEVGALHVVKTCSRDHPCPPLDFLKESGGFFHDCATHDLDLICWIIGSFPERVFATATTHDAAIENIKDIDTAVIVLNFPKTSSGRPGPIAVIDISRHGVYGYDQRVEVLGDGGMLRSENQNDAALVFDAPGATHNAPIMDSFPQRYARSYVNSLEQFVNWAIGEKMSEISAYDVINISRLAHACEKSLNSGQSVKFKPVDVKF